MMPFWHLLFAPTCSIYQQHFRAFHNRTVVDLESALHFHLEGAEGFPAFGTTPFVEPEVV